MHKIISFYSENLNPEVIKLQKMVFDKLEIPLEMVSFNGTHGSAIKNYLDNNEWDKITIFDVDCIPLNKNVIEVANTIVDNNTIYGNAQVSNSTPYAAPSFITFTKELYDTSTHKNFEGQYYLDDFGEYFEADCTEVFVKENIKRGKKMILSYPVSCEVLKWKYGGNDVFPPFEYGNGTIFDNQTYHSFQIRLREEQDIFINFVNNFLNK